MGRDGPVITDLALGSLAADEADQGSDIVELLFSLTTSVGEERAVRSAVEGLGSERLVAALPYLQLAAVSPASRHLVEKPKDLMTALRAKVAELTGAEMPKPVKLRRVTARSLIMSVLALLIVSALISAFTSVDFDAIWAALQTADWSMITLALIVGHTSSSPRRQPPCLRCHRVSPSGRC